MKIPLFHYRSCATKIFSSHSYKTTTDYQFDVVVIGGGIIGCATARALKMKYPELRMALVEKELDVGLHQSGRNSGVIHSGIYYKPGSLQARLCLSGRHKLISYLDSNSIPYRSCGKLVVAVNEEESSRLKELYQRGLENSVPDLRLIDTPHEIRSIEPLVQGVSALHCPSTAVVDYGMVTESFARDFVNLGGTVYANFEVAHVAKVFSKDHPISLTSQAPSEKRHLESKFAICCAGLYSDRLAVSCGGAVSPAIIPVRGGYLVLKRPELVNCCIYPVPFPGLPFLGVHFTPRMDGSVLVGPNAVPAFHREGYSYGHISLSDVSRMALAPGFLQFASKFVGFGISEIRKSLFVERQVAELRKYVPTLTRGDVERGPSGVRAQALAEDGTLVSDFVFEEDFGAIGGTPRILHVRNCASPGATSSMAIADEIVGRFEGMLTNKSE